MGGIGSESFGVAGLGFESHRNEIVPLQDQVDDLSDKMDSLIILVESLSSSNDILGFLK